MVRTAELPTTDPSFTVPLDEALPHFSRMPQRMGGVSHHQWLNGYLDRRSDYIRRVEAEGGEPCITDFHHEIVKEGSAPRSVLGVIAGAIGYVGDRQNTYRLHNGYETVAPFSLTAQGAREVMKRVKNA
jgi:hypothetical protein